MRASVLFPKGGAKVLVHDQALELGRGKFGITDPKISSKHLHIVFSNTTETVVAKSLSRVNPSYYWPKGEPQYIPFGPEKCVTLHDGDRVSLLPNKFILTIRISTSNAQTHGDAEGSGTVPDSISLSSISTTSKRRLSTTYSFEKEAETPKTPPKRRKVLERAQSTFMCPKLLIPEEELTLEKRIGKGSCGEVWYGRWQGTHDVAVKKIFRALLSESTVAEFRAELGILSKLRHPNVVQLWGFSKIGGDYCIAREDVIYDKSPNYRRVLNYAIRAAEGVRYLHTQVPPIIHRDIKTMNFLVGKDDDVRVADFGLARCLDTNTTETFCGTVPWTAPELLKGQPYTIKVDVYSFGIVLWELCARKVPYDGMNQSQIILEVVNSELRPPISPEWSSPLVKLMQSCWATNPNARPTMAQVIGYLRRILAELEAQDHRTGLRDSVAQFAADSRTMDTMELTLGDSDLPIIPCNDITLHSVPHKQTASINIYEGNYRGTEVSVQSFDLRNPQAKQIFSSILEIHRTIKSPVLPAALGYSPSTPGFLVYPSQGRPATVRSFLKNNKTPSLQLAVRLMMDCANSMAFLHTWKPLLVHRHITSDAFTMKSHTDGRGLEIQIPDLTHAFFANKPPPPCPSPLQPEYCPPECFGTDVYTPPSDVFSFAIVMWEIIVQAITGSYVPPYADVSPTILQHEIVQKHRRPPIPNDCPIELRELIEMSWSPRPEQRPEFAEISLQLRQYHSRM